MTRLRYFCYSKGGSDVAWTQQAKRKVPPIEDVIQLFRKLKNYLKRLVLDYIFIYFNTEVVITSFPLYQ